MGTPYFSLNFAVKLKFLIKFINNKNIIVMILRLKQCFSQKAVTKHFYLFHILAFHYFPNTIMVA